MSKEDKCDLCNGDGSLYNNTCAFCNGTGEWNPAAQAYVNSHICQCLFLDRKNCPVCHKRCHHSASLTPKQKIDPGFTGTSNTGYRSDTSTAKEMIV